MSFKLKSDFDNRIPLCIRRRNNVIYFQTQTDVAREDGYRRMTYCEEYKTAADDVMGVGLIAAELLKKFEESRTAAKKLDEKLEVLFEEFAQQCKFNT